MAILYALVARGSVVLSEFSATSTNASSIAKQILEKLPGEDVDSHVSYSQDRYVFHVKRTDGLTALCMADETAGSKPQIQSSLPNFFTCFFFNSIFFNRICGSSILGFWKLKISAFLFVCLCLSDE